jgi:cell division protein FtsI (penicillin-binding protein 3)
MSLAFVAVIARLAVVQGTASATYAAYGESQRRHAVVLPAERGSILDRNGIALAMSVPQRTVWANPQLVSDPVGEARALAPVLHADESLLRDRLSASGEFVYLARKVDDATADQVSALHLAGVSLIDESKRFEPDGPLAAPLLGSVGLDNDGLSGLELQYEHVLQGVPGELVVEQDPHGTEIPSGSRQYRPSRRGDDLVLTIDRSMQYETEQALANEIVAAHAKGGIAVVMDPRTGEILAMANLEAGVDGQPPKPAPSNLAVTNVYEPGSVNKVVTISGALEDHLIRPTDNIVVPDHLMVANGMFHDHDPHPTQPWSITDIVANSSNIGTILIGEKLGKLRIDHYLRAFGLGAHSGLGFPGESAGLLLDPKDWSGTSIGTVPIGQGLAVTALQMLEVYNTVANRGVYVAPRLVKATVGIDGKRVETAPAVPHRVISAQTANDVTAMLDEVVRVGTATAAHIDGYTVAGKTGTARKPLDGARGYSSNYVSTFAGFVPAEAPRLSAIVILDEPTPIYGGLVCAPVFAQIAQYGLRLFRIPPPAAATKAAVPAASADAAKADGDVGAAVTTPASTSVSTPVSTTVPAPPAKP